MVFGNSSSFFKKGHVNMYLRKLLKGKIGDRAWVLGSPSLEKKDMTIFLRKLLNGKDGDRGYGDRAWFWVFLL